jgi:GT2 family glycosyltransferase|tara:strand:+ start:5203 stop:6162 length:960 start_codon:yes stop_codon:yes gene_type:complete
MDVNFQRARKTYKGDIIVTTTLTNSSGEKTQDFISVDGAWAFYPSGVVLAKTTEDMVLVSQLDAIVISERLEMLADNSPIIIAETKPVEAVSYHIQGKPVVFVACSSDESPMGIDAAFDKLSNITTEYNGSVKPVEVIRVHNNRTGLSEVYNTYLTEEYRDHLVVFVHDDVHLDDGFVVEKLHEAHEKFDVVGLAGGNNPNFAPTGPPLWHLMTTDHTGFVSHIFPDGRTNMSVFGDSKKPADLLDGLLISVDVTSVLDAGVTFDEDFDFHFYDLAFCFRAKRAGLTLGTWPIFVRHEGLGQPDARWHELAPTFIERYK